jgi:hypothetical protein
VMSSAINITLVESCILRHHARARRPVHLALTVRNSR